MGVRQVADDTVAFADSLDAQPGGDGSDLAAQFAPGGLGTSAGFFDRDDGRFVGEFVVESGSQGVFGVIQPSAGEPVGTGHGPIGEDFGVGLIGDDVEEVPDRTPEPVEVAHRPLPQIVIPCHGFASALVGVVGEVGDLRSRGLVGVGKPDRFSGQFFSSAQRWALAYESHQEERLGSSYK